MPTIVRITICGFDTPKLSLDVIAQQYPVDQGADIVLSIGQGEPYRTVLPALLFKELPGPLAMILVIHIKQHQWPSIHSEKVITH
jgi:hypothetical protein